MKFLDDLNPEQRAAVLHTEGPLLILAGAGSGKTRAITYRVAYLVAAQHAWPHEILAVTFTNKAADEMRERITRLLSTSHNGITVSTFHALCARILRRDGPAIGLPRQFVIYDASDQLQTVKHAMRDLGLDDGHVAPRAVLSQISQAKNHQLGPDQVKAEALGYREELIARVYQRYAELLRGSGALDFDDLLLKTVELLEESPESRARYAARYRFVMVDEYQDTNRPQYDLIRRLTEAHRNLCVVGDPDQSIYGWRGADLRNILDFERDFPDATVVRLDRNYRSTQIILDAASALIKRNRQRKDKRLWTDWQGGEPVLRCRAGDELEEADFIVSRARDSLGADPEATVGVLYRTNAQSRVIEDALRRQRLAYRIVGNVRFYERKEVKDTLAYLKLLINPNDDVSLRRVVNVPARGIGKTLMDRLEQVPPPTPPPLLAASEKGPPPTCSLWTRVTTALDENLLPTRGRGAVTAFRDMLVGLSDIATGTQVSVLIGLVLERTGYLEALQQEHTEEAHGRIENLQELVSAAREYEMRDPAASLGGFVDQLSLLSEADEEQGAQHAQILLMTMHAAKGLEFSVVVLCGLEEGLMPHARVNGQDGENDLEEERRLCYVGMTRARRRLVLTWAARRRVFGEYQSQTPSRFIYEVPSELVEDASTAAPSSSSEVATRSWGQGNQQTPPGNRRDRSRGPVYTYEDEDQSALSVQPGMRVRHPLFGVGTVLQVEALADDLKLTVSFASAGRKKLLASYARLERV